MVGLFLSINIKVALIIAFDRKNEFLEVLLIIHNNFIEKISDFPHLVAAK
jgi:hypothetical protein